MLFRKKEETEFDFSGGRHVAPSVDKEDAGFIPVGDLDAEEDGEPIGAHGRHANLSKTIPSIATTSSATNSAAATTAIPAAKVAPASVSAAKTTAMPAAKATAAAPAAKTTAMPAAKATAAAPAAATTALHAVNNNVATAATFDDAGLDAAGFGQEQPSPFFSSFDEEPKKSHKGLKIFGIVMGVLLLVCAAVYGGGAWFFSGHFLPNTTLNGVDVSFKAPADIEDEVNATLSDYALTISGYDYEQTIAGSDISYKLDNSVNMLEKVNFWAWPVEIINNAGKDTQVPVTYDETALKTKIDETVTAHNETAEQPKDAYVEYDSASDAVVIRAEVMGSQLKADVILTKAEECLDSIKSSLTLDTDSLNGPSLTSDSEGLKREVDQINNLSQVNVTLTLGGYDAVKVNRSNLLDWISVDENFNVTLDSDKVSEWAQEVAEKLDTYGKEHHYTRPDGKEVTVNSDDYGWSVDTDSLKDTIVDAVNNGTQGTIEIPCSNSADYYNLESGAEWRHYIDVDLSEQHAYYYDDDGNCIWETDIISGNINISTRATPTGIYRITRKSTNETLYTYNEGETEPSTCVVAYWMPFIGNVYALHDAWWQPGFGGTMYKDGYGSHGCVNLPTTKAAELYDICSVGDVVVVHW